MEPEKTEIVGGGMPVGEIATGDQSDAGDDGGGFVDAADDESPAADAADDANAPVDAGAEDAGAPPDDAAADAELPPSDAQLAVDAPTAETGAGTPADAVGADLPEDAGVPGSDAANGADGAGGGDGADGASTDVAAPNGADAHSPAPGPDTVVGLFSGRHLYYGNETTRRADAAVTFPVMPALYEQITLSLALRCPTGGCDQVEKRGFLGLVRRTAQGSEVVTELVRFISPAGVGATWSIDLTPLRPLLTGNATVRVFVETWVGPGSPGGAGYVVDASVQFRGGWPTRRPIAVIPIWNETSFVHGDPNAPGAAAVAPRQVTLPAGTGTAELRAIITGHGQGNLDGCGAFCKKAHRFVVGATPFERVVWRDDCAATGAPGQLGAWTTSRAGWCPGAPTVPWVVDVTGAFTGPETTVSYGIADYVNSCRPGAPVCGGCSMGTSCAYNGGNHTPPTYFVSALLIAYAP